MTDEEKKEALPSPQEIQKEIEALMRNKFGKNIQIIAQPFEFGDGAKHQEEETELNEDIVDQKEFDLNFNLTPKQVKEFLDKYVIKQDEAKRALAIAVCDHYNHVRQCHLNKLAGIIDSENDNYSKQNVLMLGPTGVGKTYLVKTLAKLIGVPFVKADATKFTEMGYVGANVDDLVRDLVRMAKDDIELAQYGIIYFDEADKIAGNKNVAGKDISGRGVQYALLKLMEETEIDLRSAHDIASQMQAFMDFQKNGKVSPKVINTKHILFIVSGAFCGMDEIIKKRLKVRTIGLNNSEDKNAIDEFNILDYATTKDFIDFGFEPEFIGRLPVRLSCTKLLADDLYKILKDSKGSIIRQYEQSFKAYGIDVTFEDEALQRIAQLAYTENTGARALMTVCEKIFRSYKFELPGTVVQSFKVTKELVENPDEELKAILTRSLHN
jgi:ATP-dependent Clp protease ATP-binding subunit ClpX